MSDAMDVHHDDLPAANLSNPHDIKEIEDAITQSRKDNDVQTVFYLNSVSDLDVNPDAVLITTYDWATRIEVKVQSDFDHGKPADRDSIQASWDRASHRAELVDSLAKNTRWFTFTSNQAVRLGRRELTEDYHRDKLIYQNLVHEFLGPRTPTVPEHRLRFIEKYIAETLVLSQDKLVGSQSFAVGVSWKELTKPINIVVQRFRVLLLGFARSRDDAAEKLTVEVNGNLYEIRVNQRAFEGEKFDQQKLDLGKPLAEEWTIDVPA